MLKKLGFLILWIPILSAAQPVPPKIPGEWVCRYHPEQGKELCCWTTAKGETDICYDPNAQNQAAPDSID